MAVVIPIRQSILPKQEVKPYEEKPNHEKEADNVLYLLILLLGVSMAETKHSRMEGAVTRLEKIEKILAKLTKDLNQKLEKLSQLAQLPEGSTIDRVLLAQLQEQYKNLTSEVSKRNNEVLRLGEIDVKGLQKSLEAASNLSAGLIGVYLAASRVANSSLK